MRPPPYIGVTGFMHENEVRAALEVFPAESPRKLMIGILASAKTLRGQGNKYPNRYPEVREISRITFKNDLVLNTIHYSSDETGLLSEEIMLLRDEYAGTIDAYQFNLVWPDPVYLCDMIPKHQRVILQLGPRAMAMVQNGPLQLAKQLDRYQDIITDVLVDASGGLGKLFDAKVALTHVRAIAERHPDLGVGVAGGLRAGTLGELTLILREFPWISFDAESGLRTDDDRLDMGKVRSYLLGATRLVAQYA